MAWFYLLLVRHVAFGRFSEVFADDPVGWTLSLLKGESFALDATQAAWSMLFDDDPPGEEAVRQIQSVCDAVRAGQEGFRAANKRELFQACMQVRAACRDAKDAIVQAIRPRLPMAQGSYVADGQGRRAVVIDVRGVHALLYWEDGRITRERLLAACDGSNWRWPVAHGPRFDDCASFDPIDQRRLRFWELDASPVDIVCPVCGYPSTDDVWVEVQDCDVCGFELYETIDCLHAEDRTETDDGQWLTPRLNEARERFRRTTWSGPEDEDVHPESYRAKMRDPRYRALVRDYMAEWDAWLNDPDPQRKPIEMWRRWNRLRGSPTEAGTSERSTPFAAFLRHRYRAHVQGWLMLLVAGLAGYYISLFPHEPLWLLAPVAFLVAFFVVAVGVAVAALLRMPWWLLAPLAFLSMTVEWAWRKRWHRPWRRQPQPREPFLSHPFALWQRRRLRRLRRERARARAGAAIIAFPAARATRSAPRVARHPPRHPSWSAQGLGSYLGEVFEQHWTFWMLAAPVAITLWFWLVEDQMFVVALILGVLLWLLGSVTLVIPIAAGLLALASALGVGAGLTPLQRQAVVQHAAAQRAAGAQAAAAMPPSAPPRRGSWVWPLLIGLWIGSAWGRGE